MRQTTITGAEVSDVIAEASRRHTPVVLSIRADEGWRTMKSELVPGGPDDERVHVAYPELSAQLKASSLERGALLGVSFRRGHKKCMFAGVVEDRMPVQSEDGNVDVLALNPPQSLHLLQRRVYYRTPVPPEQRIEVAISIDEGARNDDVKGLLRNVSVGGMAVGLSDTKSVHYSAGQTVTAVIQLPTGEPLTTEVNYRHQAIVGNELQLGFQFVGLETTPEGRRALQRLSQLALRMQRQYR